MPPPPSPDLPSLSEEDLVALCREELPYRMDGYREVLRRYERHIFNTAHRIIGSLPDAEEVCQDTFLQVYHKLHLFEGRSTFKTWLFRIAYNFSIRRREVIVKRRRREHEVGVELAWQDSLRGDDGLDAFGEDVRAVLAAMPDDQREILVLRFVSGLSLAEIADVLQLGTSAAKMRLYRSLEQFKIAYERKKRAEEH